MVYDGRPRSGPTIRPYSTAVAPSSSATNFLIASDMSDPPCCFGLSPEAYPPRSGLDRDKKNDTG